MKTNRRINQRLPNRALLHWSFSNNFTQTALIGQEVCQETSQPPRPLFHVLPLKCLFNFDSHIKILRGVPHYTLEPTQLQDKSDTVYAVPSSEWLKEILDPTMQWYQRCVNRQLALWLFAQWGYFAERRCGTSQLRLLIDESLHMTWHRAVSPMEPNLVTYSIDVQPPFPFTLHCVRYYTGGPAQWARALGNVLCQGKRRNRS